MRPPIRLTALAAVWLAAVLLVSCSATETTDPSVPAEPVQPNEPVQQSEPDQPNELAQLTVLRVVATGCPTARHGTGFVGGLAQGEVLVATAAHVVGGAEHVALLDEHDQTLAATDPTSVGGLAQVAPLRLVVFDSARDVAVFAVTGLPLTGLPQTGLAAPEWAATAPQLAAGTAKLAADAPTQPAIRIAGYPRGQPFAAVSARLVSAETTDVTDIYGATTTPLRMLALEGEISPGYSGAPVVGPASGSLDSPADSVWGMVVAVGSDDDTQRVIAALSADELAVALTQAHGATQASADPPSPVEAGPCVATGS